MVLCLSLCALIAAVKAMHRKVTEQYMLVYILRAIFDGLMILSKIRWVYRKVGIMLQPMDFNSAFLKCQAVLTVFFLLFMLLLLLLLSAISINSFGCCCWCYTLFSAFLALPFNSSLFVVFARVYVSLTHACIYVCIYILDAISFSIICCFSFALHRNCRLFIILLCYSFVFIIKTNNCFEA